MSLGDASEIQRRMYDFIVNYMKSEGMAPTNREIGRALNIISTGHVDYHLTILEKKGLISRQPMKSRGISITKQTHEGVPIIGTIAAGEPIDIFEEATNSVDIGHNSTDTENIYALIVRGRSMIEDHICDGDYVVIKNQATYQDGDIIVAIHKYEGVKKSATLKRFFQEKNQDRIRLQPMNVDMDPILIPKKVWDHEWLIQGKVISVFRSINGQNNLESDSSFLYSNDTIVYSNDAIQDAMNAAMSNLKVTIDRAKAIIGDNEVGSNHTSETDAKQSNNNNNESKQVDIDIQNVNLHSGSSTIEIIEKVNNVVELAIQQQKVAFDRLSHNLDNNHMQLDQIYTQGHKQASHWFLFGIIAASIGFAVIIIGAIMTMFFVHLSGIITSLASIVPGTISLLFFQQAKEANKRMDGIYNKLDEQEWINKATNLSLTADTNRREYYNELIIRTLLKIREQN